MNYSVVYRIDDVGYGKTVEAATEEEARVTCEAELCKAYPASVCTVLTVEPIESVEPVKTKTKKIGKKKDSDDSEEDEGE